MELILKQAGKILANYLKTIKEPKYGIWGMMKNKEPDLFIKQFKGVFKKIITTSYNKMKKTHCRKII